MLAAHSGTDGASGKMPVESRMQVMPAVMRSVRGNPLTGGAAVSIEQRFSNCGLRPEVGERRRRSASTSSEPPLADRRLAPVAEDLSTARSTPPRRGARVEM
jgi:hypothetical protein